MNKTYLIVGGASAASLAVGGAGGYFLAKKKFSERLEALIDIEVDKTKKVYSLLLMQAEKTANPPQVVTAPDEDEQLELEAEDPPEELSEADKKTVRRGQRALVDYQSFGGKVNTGEIVANNIFSDDASRAKKAMPPRGPGGKFMPKTAPVEENTTKASDGAPYLIEPEVFLANEPDHEQESLLYFVNDDTVVLTADPNEAIDNARVGETNLNCFPPGESPVIFVRHDGMQIDYQITRVEESLTAFMGMGEEDEAVDMEALDPEQEVLEDEYAHQD